MLYIIPKYPPEVSPISASGESSLRCSDAREGFCSSLGVEFLPWAKFAEISATKW